MSTGYKPLAAKSKSLTQQHMEPQTNINTIVESFHKTRILPQANSLTKYGDFSNVTTFHDAMNQVIDGQNAFMELPGSIRERFGNDPGNLMIFLANPKNKEEAEKLGFLNPAPADSEPAKPAGSRPGGTTTKSSRTVKQPVEPLEEEDPEEEEPKAHKKLVRRTN